MASVLEQVAKLATVSGTELNNVSPFKGTGCFSPFKDLWPFSQDQKMRSDAKCT
jgi:hypothetical protein